MTDTGYMYLAERLADVLRRHSPTFDLTKVDEDWETIVDDNSEEFVAITAERLEATVLAIAQYGTGPDPRAMQHHPLHLQQLRRHDGCAAAIEALTAQRDDHLAALQDTASYCLSDSYEGKYGDAYLNIESVLDELRPRLPDRTYRRLLDPDNCPECGNLWDHDEDCSFEEDHAALAQRRAAAIEAHIICTDMGQALIAHIDACLNQIERIAAYIVQHQVYAEDDGMVLRADDIHGEICLDDVDWKYDRSRPATIAVARHIALR